MKVTIKDVSRFANVSVGTVSMVINGKAGVNEETRKRVLEAIQKLNYRPNQHARSLITKKSSTIGLIVTNIANPFFGNLVSCMKEEVEKAGYDLLLGLSNDSVVQEKRAIEHLIGRHAEGIMIVPTRDGEKDLSHLYNMKLQGIPFVFTTTSYRGIEADCVMTDFAKGSYDLTKHLLANGVKKIVFITDYKDLLFSLKRIEGYKKAFAESGAYYSEDWIVESYPDFENGYQVTDQLLQSDPPEAIITVNDIMAMGVNKCLKDKGIAVPGKISIAGYDDLLFSSLLETPLTTVRQPIEEICRLTLKALLNRIGEGEKKDPFATQLVEPELIVRASTK